MKLIKIITYRIKIQVIDMDENTNMNTNMNPEQEPEPEQQQIIIPMNIMNIMDMMNMMNTDNVPQMNSQSLEERVTQESFHQPNKFKHVSSKDFINSLSVQKVSDEMIKEKTTCALCLDELELNEDIIELPCPDKHYFHLKKEECEGIYPWLKENNSCPLCRHEFPSTEVEVKEEESIDNTPRRMNPVIITPRRIQSIVRQVIDQEEERMMQEVLYDSLQTPQK